MIKIINFFKLFVYSLLFMLICKHTSSWWDVREVVEILAPIKINFSSNSNHVSIGFVTWKLNLFLNSVTTTESFFFGWRQNKKFFFSRIRENNSERFHSDEKKNHKKCLIWEFILFSHFYYFVGYKNIWKKFNTFFVQT